MQTQKTNSIYRSSLSCKSIYILIPGEEKKYSLSGSARKVTHKMDIFQLNHSMSKFIHQFKMNDYPLFFYF